MLEVGVIFPLDKEKWVSPIVIQNKKYATEIRFCIDNRSLNNACAHDPFPTPFSDEVQDNIAGN